MKSKKIFIQPPIFTLATCFLQEKKNLHEGQTPPTPSPAKWRAFQSGAGTFQPPPPPLFLGLSEDDLPNFNV